MPGRLTDDTELSVGEDASVFVLRHALVHADVTQVQVADCQHTVIRLDPVLLQTCAQPQTSKQKNKKTKLSSPTSHNVKEARGAVRAVPNPGRRKANRLGQGDQSAAAVITSN